MFVRVVLFLIFALLVGYGASWLSAQEGAANINWLGYRIEVESSWLVVAIIGLCVASLLADRMVRALVRWPSLFSQGWQKRRHEKGTMALSLGFVALAAGDERAAKKQAKRAEKLLERGILTDLLVAQSSYASGDNRAAARYFKKLAGAKETAYFGQLGLMRLYQQQSDEALSLEAFGAAQKAFALDPTSAEAAQFILRKALADRHWEKATSCLKVYLNQSGGRSEAEIMRAQDLYARLLVQMAQEAYDEAKGAEQVVALAEQALGQRPDFAPASALLCAALLDKGNKKAAQKAASKGFLAFPHEMSLATLRKVRSDNDGQFITYALGLAAKSVRPDEGYLAVAQFAISVGIWASASQALSQISEGYICHNHFYMIEAAIGKGIDDDALYQRAMRDAAEAPRGAIWGCDLCGYGHRDYDFFCGSCQAPGQMRWSGGVSDHMVGDKKIAP